MFLGVTGMLWPMTYTERERLTLGRVVRRKRVADGLDKEPAARKADVSSITWKRIEDGEGVRDASLTKVLSSLSLPTAEEILEDHQRLGESLKKLIPTSDEVPAEPPIEDDPVVALGELVEQGWRIAQALTSAVTMSDPSDELLAAARDAVHFIDSYLIIRILDSGHAAQMEKWLARIYRERDVFYRQLSRAEPQFPWAPDAFDSPEAAAAHFVQPQIIEEDGNGMEAAKESPASTEAVEDEKTSNGPEDWPVQFWKRGPGTAKDNP